MGLLGSLGVCLFLPDKVWPAEEKYEILKQFLTLIYSCLCQGAHGHLHLRGLQRCPQKCHPRVPDPCLLWVTSGKISFQYSITVMANFLVNYKNVWFLFDFCSLSNYLGGWAGRGRLPGKNKCLNRKFFYKIICIPLIKYLLVLKRKLESYKNNHNNFNCLSLNTVFRGRQLFLSAMSRPGQGRLMIIQNVSLWSKYWIGPFPLIYVGWIEKKTD